MSRRVVLVVALAAAAIVVVAPARPQAAGDPLLAQSQPALEAMHVPEAWRVTQGSVTVAIVDRGVNAVPDLRGALLPGWNVDTRTRNVTDTDRHGTALASIVAARAGNGVGSVGVCPHCRIVPVKGAAPAAITWAWEHGAKVIVATLYADDPVAVRAAVVAAVRHGAVVVIPAGNESSTVPDALAGSGAIRVAALYQGVALLSSNHGPWVDVAGVTPLVASFDDGTYDLFGKSSTASAAVAGVAALMRSANPQLSPALVRSILMTSGTRVPGLDVGSERIVNAAAAVRRARAMLRRHETSPR